MIKNAKRVVILLLFIIIGLINLYLVVRLNSKANSETINLSDKDQLIAVYLQDEDNYVKSSTGAFPSEGYILNIDMSSCTSGGKLSQDLETKKIFLEAGSADSCTLYFDKVLSEAKYWNDDFGDVEYPHPNTPSTTYGSVAELQAGYSNFSNRPYYIKTTGTEHQACLFLNNKEFCIGAEYWEIDKNTTNTKLKNEMEAVFGEDYYLDCDFKYSYAFCEMGNEFSCSAGSGGYVSCGDSNQSMIRSFCHVRGNTGYCDIYDDSPGGDDWD